MSGKTLVDYLEQLRQASSDALSYVEGLTFDDFLADKRTQQAVIMTLIIIGEAAARIAHRHADFAAAHPEIPLRNMRGMRNRIAHGYFDIDLQVVWETVQTALPRLIEALADVGHEE